ncbi:UNVERIFIED_CONTAM: IAA-alanine resistance protein 1 [Sesamum calycinum]|uniref:IAA-alanine resistance protein 1 n=1 Tax=Sesamum calycinum TaxID=2727403 RepID=A0AAW2QYA6_9LAMI
MGLEFGLHSLRPFLSCTKVNGGVSDERRRICSYVFGVLVVVGFGFFVAAAHQCSHGHHHHDHDHDHLHDEVVGLTKEMKRQQVLLPEEMAEEEDLKMMWAHDDHDHDFELLHGGHKHGGHVELSGLWLWLHAMACSLLVSLASLICLILLPLIFIQGKPSKTLVDSLALFGAGAMLGDAFLHQLPHAFGGEHSHSHDHHDDHDHHHHAQFGQSHSHSLEDLSIGLSILAGIVVFLIVEKIVRYVEEFSGGENVWGLGHHHHHHHHKHTNKLKDDGHALENHQGLSHAEKNERLSEKTAEEKDLDRADDTACSDKKSKKDVLRKRNTSNSSNKDGTESSIDTISNGNVESIHRKEPVKSQSNLVIGYLNLFSDGVHNFTDGMALGSAFLLYGSVGGWSRTLFLLAHELPQEAGQLCNSFLVSENVYTTTTYTIAGTALVRRLLRLGEACVHLHVLHNGSFTNLSSIDIQALIWGKDPGHSSWIEGFTAGGFIYIALAGVLAEMNNGTSALRNTAVQIISLLLGMAVALCISLVE